MFPSPYGESYFLTSIARLQKKAEESVSVPLRGILFLNAIKQDIKVLVQKFPSPYGESYFLTGLCIPRGLSIDCFHPLTGNLIS